MVYPMAFDVPILLLVFNRPNTTEKVFSKIKEIQPGKLFIAADGPRGGIEGEKEKCDAVRKLILEGIDWPCELKILFRDQNLGCGLAVSGAISWFFEHVEEGIILEDDTLPDLSFFSFCKELLAKYRFHDRIKMISGNNFQKGKWRGDGSYYFSAYSHIWGWATWRRAWQQYDFSLKELDDNSIDDCMRKYFKENSVLEYWKKTFQLVKRGMINTWDYQLLFSIWKDDGVSIIPNMNLVSNIGFGQFSTHTLYENDKASNIHLSSIKEIIHTEKIVIDKNADGYHFKNNIQTHIGLFKKIKNKLIRANK
jgi:hypothetical protein